MATTKVLLVDDHTLFREGLASLLAAQEDIEIVGEAVDGLDAIEKARELTPDLILMDVKMPHCNGIEATRIIKEELPATRIVMLTVSEDDQDLFDAVAYGAEGYLLKTLKSAELFELLKGVFQGEAPISRSMSRKMLDEFIRRSRQPDLPVKASTDLTQRESEVLQLLSEGISDKEIASRLYISVRTVKNHVHQILKKLQLQNRVQAAAYALRQGQLQDRQDAI